MTFTTIRGTGGAADTFAGSNGVDTIAFVNQTNSFLLYGAQSNDVVTVAANFQTALAGSLVGGQGDDNYNTGAGAFAGSLQGSTGNDTLTVAQLIGGTIQGGQNNDVITVTSNINGAQINGNKDLDTIVTGVAAGTAYTISNSTIRGGNGIDNFTINAGATLVDSSFYGDEGNDVIVSSIAAVAANAVAYTRSTIFGGNGDDNITGAGANDVISGDAGNDRITGDNGADSLYGGSGNDNIVYTDNGQSATGDIGAGATAVNLTATVDQIWGLGAGDTITTGLAAFGASAAAATGLLTGGAGAATAALVRGTFNSNGTFTAGTAATDIDYAFQWAAAGAAAANIQTIILQDVGVLGAATNNAANTGVFTLS